MIKDAGPGVDKHSLVKRFSVSMGAPVSVCGGENAREEPSNLYMLSMYFTTELQLQLRNSCFAFLKHNIKPGSLHKCRNTFPPMNSFANPGNQ